MGRHHAPWQAWLVLLALCNSSSGFSPSTIRRKIRKDSVAGSRQSHPFDFRQSPWITSSSSSLTSRTRLSALQNVELMLLDLPYEKDEENAFVVPLPSDHLPRELSTISVYGLQLSLPLHQLIVQQAMELNRGIFGQVAFKKEKDSWVGAIGCATQVLLLDKGEDKAKTDGDAESLAVGSSNIPPGTATQPHMVLIQGKWRFVVKEVLSTIPYPIVLVDELDDDENDGASSGAGDDDKDLPYAALTPSELVERLLDAMKTHAKQQLEAIESKEISPLEQSIAEGFMNLSMERAAEKRAAEEMVAIVDVVSLSLEDICPTPQEQYYCLGFLAAELAGFSNDLRKECLVMMDSVERMRLALRKLDELISRQQAMTITELITKRQDDDERELKVGVPTLPAWARQIRKGMRLEYYWNEEYEWCEGEIVEDPLFVVDEVILTVYFPSDGTTHRLPITAEEKARWRPVR